MRRGMRRRASGGMGAGWTAAVALLSVCLGWPGAAGGKHSVTDEVFLDVVLYLGRGAEESLGRIVVGVFGDAVPITAFNFVSLAKGFHHVNSGQVWTYERCVFHRIVPDFVVQTGDVVLNDGRGGRSVFAPFFIDENYSHSHVGPGMVGMANTGFDTNNSQFYITLRPTRWLDKRNVVFGKVVEGYAVVKELTRLPVDDRGKPLTKVFISRSGVLPLDQSYELGPNWLQTSSDIPQDYRRPPRETFSAPKPIPAPPKQQRPKEVHYVIKSPPAP